MKKYRILQHTLGENTVYFVQQRVWLFFWATNSYGNLWYNTNGCTDYYYTVDQAKARIRHLQTPVSKHTVKTKVVEYL